ncbi:metal-dependent hydrolase [Candidatus Woesearchaeota archaeon]|nr:metal-dependent hydrolase [Candidatus Woesearchaeota archaeon]
MLFKTHLMFGIFLITLLYTFFPSIITSHNIYSQIIFCVILLTSTSLPDIDTKESKISRKIPILPTIISIFTIHRGIIHSVYPVIILSAVLYQYSSFYTFAFIIGYSSHLILDALTIQGINFLHPFTQFHVKGFIKTGSIFELILFISLIAISAVLALSTRHL